MKVEVCKRFPRFPYLHSGEGVVGVFSASKTAIQVIGLLQLSQVTQHHAMDLHNTKTERYTCTQRMHEHAHSACMNMHMVNAYTCTRHKHVHARTHACTCMHMTHACTCTWHMHVHAQDTCVYIHAHMHLHAHTYACTCTQCMDAQVHTCMYTQCMHVHAHSTCIHMHTHTHTHAHTNARSLFLLPYYLM